MQRARLFAVLFCACTPAERVPEVPTVDIGADGGGAAPMVIEPLQSNAHGGTSADGIVGRWRGMGTQDDGQSWAMEVDVQATRPGPCATVVYPSIPCRAEWVCLRTSGGVVEAQERLVDDDAHRCVDDGEMTMRVAEDGTLDWRWNAPGQTASARLRRVR